ncbi:SIS domain-containing protein [Candidatus Peregrinibacteria bacterium]|nr:SIS domain-containing protein [Candidatus Peregrinibacteria bacterium]
MDIDFPKQYIDQLVVGFSKIPTKAFEAIVDVIMEAYKDEKQIFIIGNGGSAAIASHVACDLGKGALTNVYDIGEKRLRVISLTDNMPLFSALANDIGYEHVFEQQLRNLLKAGDVVIGISGSGNSENVLNALQYARDMKATTVGFIGFDGGKMKSLCDYYLHFEENNYQRCEDAHLIFQHLIASWMAKKKKRFDEDIKKNRKHGRLFVDMPVDSVKKTVKKSKNV